MASLQDTIRIYLQPILAFKRWDILVRWSGHNLGAAFLGRSICSHSYLKEPCPPKTVQNVLRIPRESAVPVVSCHLQAASAGQFVLQKEWRPPIVAGAASRRVRSGHIGRSFCKQWRHPELYSDCNLGCRILYPGPSKAHKLHSRLRLDSDACPVKANEGGTGSGLL